MVRIGVIGAGSWGTALAKLLCENGHRVCLWGRRAELIQQLAHQRCSQTYLPDITLPSDLNFSANMNEATIDADVLFIATPSHALRTVLQNIPELKKDCILVSAIKGLEPETNLRMSEVIAEIIKQSNDIVALSGPNLAAEVAAQKPTVAVTACGNIDAAKKVQTLLMNCYFRIYSHSDIIGVELGGAFKNIIALAAGISDGAGCGDNAKAALMTRGLAEITRLGNYYNADPMTFAGLSGIGDLIVTCMSKKSRNRYVGEQIGKGRKLEDVLKEMQMIAEGVRTTQAAYTLAQKHNIDLPIAMEVYKVLFENKASDEAIHDLMLREPKMETFG